MENEVISYVYFGVSEDRSGFKIGVSQNPLRRNTQFSEKLIYLIALNLVARNLMLFELKNPFIFYLIKIANKKTRATDIRNGLIFLLSMK